MWRAWLSVLAATALAACAPPPSAARPVDAAAGARPASTGVVARLVTVRHGDEVCTVTDPRLNELSGMVRQPKGFAVIDDGSDLASHWQIFYLDDRCRVTRTVQYPSRPRDTEDLALGRDGTLWVADIGDNNETRSTVALWRLASGAHTPVLYRLRYPDRAHDAEALVLTGDGTPVIVTKDVGEAVLYQPAGALQPGGTVPLRRVGVFDLPLSGTSNPFSFAGHMVVTGGANSPDGTRVEAALRRTDGFAEISVTDNGPGVPPEIQPVVFERFTRADASRARQGNGSSTGLGLAIVSAVVKAHGGQVGLESRPGHTRFTVRVPLA